MKSYRKDLIASQSSGGDHVQRGIIFSIAKDTFLRTSAIVEFQPAQL